MNARTLELIQNPDLFQPEDFSLIEKDIAQTPFAQSLRAIYLYGVHRFRPEDYTNVLSKTAAYTTDKKLLYYLINKKSLIVENQEVSEFVTQDDKAEQGSQNSDLETIEEKASEVKEVLREEEIVEEVIQPKIQLKEKTEDLEEEENTEITFHQFNEFLPKVEFKTQAVSENVKPQLQETKKTKQEEEMQRLIAEVEAKMKANKTKKLVDEKDEAIERSSEISFADTQNFSIPELDKIEEQKSESEIVEAKAEENISKKEWKPMNFNSNTPDALIQKMQSKPLAQPQSQPQPQPELSNIPQFLDTWQNWLKLNKGKSEDASNDKISEIEVVEGVTPAEQPVETENTEEVKAKAIDAFIENNPKISKLNKEAEYEVKEKKSNISHLMTETLANLYIEQRLYNKAIDAFEILKDKHPEKTEFFNSKIEEIKVLKNNK